MLDKLFYGFYIGRCLLEYFYVRCSWAGGFWGRGDIWDPVFYIFFNFLEINLFVSH